MAGMLKLLTFILPLAFILASCAGNDAESKPPEVSPDSVPVIKRFDYYWDGGSIGANYAGPDGEMVFVRLGISKLLSDAAIQVSPNEKFQKDVKTFSKGEYGDFFKSLDSVYITEYALGQLFASLAENADSDASFTLLAGLINVYVPHCDGFFLICPSSRQKKKDTMQKSGARKRLTEELRRNG